MVDPNELIEDFATETGELLELLENSVMELEQGNTDPELVNSIFRYVHTIKGTSSFLGLANISQASHNVETVLDKLRKNLLSVSEDIIELILLFVDHGRAFLDKLTKREHESHDFSELVEAASAVLEGESSRLSVPETQTAPPVEPAAAAKPETDAVENGLLALLDEAPEVSPNIELPWEKLKSGRRKVVEPGKSDIPDEGGHSEKDESKKKTVKIWINPDRLPGSKMESKESHGPVTPGFITRSPVRRELSQDTAPLQRSSSPEAGLHSSRTRILKTGEVNARESKPDDKKKTAVRESAAGSGKKRSSRSTLGRTAFLARSTIRVDLKRIDDLVNQVVDVFSYQHRLREIVDPRNPDRLRMIDAEIAGVVDSLSRATMDLHKAIMKVRMVPLSTLFDRFPRLIRDLAQRENKPLRLDTIREETELDKTILEWIADPLLHLIRNAAAHGIESREEREAAGKPRTGTISLSTRSVGDQVLISVEDDGKGMDVDKIAAKAIQKGLITPEQRRQISDNELLNLVFAPGFSTRDEASGTAGRGVGMDVVQSNVSNVGGTVIIESEKGRGTNITLRLPLTLAILQALLVRIDETLLAVPLHVVKNIVETPDVKLEVIQGRRCYRDDAGVIPVMDLAKAVGFADEEKIRKFIIVVSGTGKQFGLCIDGYIGQESIVAKQVSPLLGRVPGISGATIRGDGRVVLILDVNQLAPATWRDEG